MKTGTVLPFLCVLCLSLVHVQDAAAEDGSNFCEESDSVRQPCYCDGYMVPIDINCDSVGLTSLWEEADWKATLKALNATPDSEIYVTFMNNDITHVNVFPSLNITYLSLRHNKINRIDPYAFSKLEKLDVLVLAQNELTSDALVEEVFVGKFKDGNNGYFPMPLKNLDLSYNQIHSIPKNTFDHFNNLVSLDLSHNPLETLDGNSKYAISDLPSLEFLGLSNTSLSKIPDALLHDLNHLTALDLSYNLFKKVPIQLQETNKLLVLNLTGNWFEILDNESFLNLTSLEELAVNNVRSLKQIGANTFAPLKKLEKLFLQFNKHLKEIDDAAFVRMDDNSTSPLKEIYFNDNGLTYIHESLFTSWDDITHFDAQNNPFRCDCQMAWFVLEFVDKLKSWDPQLVRDLTCSEPEELKGKKMLGLTKERELFKKCSSTKRIFSEVDDPTSQNSLKATGVTILVIGVLLILIGLTLIIFVTVKKRAITQSLLTPSQIRYERADTEDGSEWRHNQNQPSSVYK